MEKVKIAIVGGGAAGLFACARLSAHNVKPVLLERNDRLGKKLSATGNGQGNLSNQHLSPDRYFSVEKTDSHALKNALSRFGVKELYAYMRSLGTLLFADERGRVYPTSRQASSLTDALRFYLAEKADIRLSSLVKSVQKTKDGFLIEYENEGTTRRMLAEYLLFATGGKAAKNFGTDGSAYSLLRSLGHTLTPLYPSLVQLKTDVTHTKALKGIRVPSARVTATVNGKTQSVTGDIIFTDYGVSGDAAFRLSAFLAGDKLDLATLSIDFLPDFTKDALTEFLAEKLSNGGTRKGELLCGVLNNQIARAIERRYENASVKTLVEAIKSFTLSIKGSLGFDYAQVTKGGVKTDEIDENFQSKFAENAYLLGELLDIDGECGGYNLHFAYASASVAATDVLQKIQKTRGQV